MASNEPAKKRSDASVPASAPGRRPEVKSDPLDRLIHERQRLAIVSALAVNPVLTFTELKRMLELSDGNLSVHAQKLEAAGYIDCTKGFDGRVPRTEYRLTATGQAALEAYLSHMEALIAAVRRK